MSGYGKSSVRFVNCLQGEGPFGQALEMIWQTEQARDETLAEAQFL